jgi:hypothetical protein
MSEPPPGRTYSQEEVTEILKRALKQQSQRGNQLSHDELVEMADEVGIDRGSLEAATADLVQTRAQELAHQDDAREITAERSRRIGRFVSSLFTYLIVGTFLFLIDIRTSGGTWFYWPLLGFGIALAFQLRGIFFAHEGLERRRRQEQKLARRMERKAAREAWRQRMHATLGASPAEAVNNGAKEFEAAVQAGVAALLTVAARKIQAHAERSAQEDHRTHGSRRQR